MTEDGHAFHVDPQAGPDDGGRPVTHDGTAFVPEWQEAQTPVQTPAQADPPAPVALPGEPPVAMPPLPPARTPVASALANPMTVAAPAHAGVPASADATAPVATSEEGGKHRLGLLERWLVRIGAPPAAAGTIAWVVEFVVLVLAAFLLATGIKTWVVQPFYIPSGSMEPTLAVGDRVLVNKFIYAFTSPKSGDVVVFVSPEGPQTDLIKRVVAVGGQTVEVRQGYVYVDGKKIEEAYIAQERRDDFTSPGPTKVPAGYVWVMGDNRGNSADSRVIGPQPVAGILGRAFSIYWPLNRISGL